MPQKLCPSFTFTEDRLKELQAVVPEAFADGKINWETLREALGEHLEDETQEHFGLTWPGKREARGLAALPPQGTLVPAPGEGVNEETARHLFIEGENLEVLKLLQKSYAGRVNIIYIDPPYNTGNDFIYEDDYSEPLEAYLKRTGQMDEAGRRLTTNTKASGRFHSRWLSMIYPRLLLARQLLREDGVIFVSIDDNEVYHLRSIMNEIFGEENFITLFIWEKTQHFGRQTANCYANSDYIMVYAKSLQSMQGTKSRRLVEQIKTNLEDAPLYNGSNPVSEITFPAGSTRFNIHDGVYTKTTDFKYVLLNPVTVKNGVNENEFTLRFRSRWSKDTVLEEFKKGTRYWVKSEKFAIRAIYPMTKESIESPRQIIFTNPNHPLATFSRFNQRVGTNEEGTSELNQILGVSLDQMYPKPSSLISYLISIVFDDEKQAFLEEGIVLDFFAGSSTTAHAVLQQNRENGANYQFIMVQLPEPTPPDSPARQAGFTTIAEIGKERIRRVIRKLSEAENGQLSLPSSVNAQPSSLGFRVFKLARSHFKPWSPLQPAPAERLDDLFQQSASPLIPGWTPEGLLTEILLLEGFPLDSVLVRLQDAFPQNAVQRVTHPDVGHELFVCLDESLHPSTVERLLSGNFLRREDIFICLDAALTDEAKVRLDDALRLKVI